MISWRWTLVWCGECNEGLVVLGHRRIKHTDQRPECVSCLLDKIAEGLGVHEHI